jgi:hypothetical protein
MLKNSLEAIDRKSNQGLEKVITRTLLLLLIKQHRQKVLPQCILPPLFGYNKEQLT